MNVLLSGATRDGRTGFAGRLADEFRRQDLLPGGFLCPPAEQDGAGPAEVYADLRRSMRGLGTQLRELR